MEFTFVHTTDRPGLTQAEARRVRGHNTKKSFAKRRKRLAESKKREADFGSRKSVLESKGLSVIRASQDATPPESASFLLANVPLPSYCFNDLQLFTYLNGTGTPKTPTEVAWFDMVANDPAFFEASMAIVVKNWSPDVKFQERAAYHRSRAISALIKRIELDQAHTDGVIGAVFAVAFGERLENNPNGWQIHIDGLVRLLQARHSRGHWALPSWFSGLLVFDMMNGVLGSARLFHTAIIDTLSGFGGTTMAVISTMSKDLLALRRAMITARKTADPVFISKEVEVPIQRLRKKAQGLRLHQDPYVRAMALSTELYIGLSWPSQPSNLAGLAVGLKMAITALPIRACPYMDLTSVPIVLGLIASERGSEARQWFLTKSQQIVAAMRMRGWKQPGQCLQRAVMSDEVLSARFRAVWCEEGGDQLMIM